MKVYNVSGHRNQFCINDDKGTITFYSYNSQIADYKDGNLILYGSMWDYSNTTRKHFYQWLKDNTPFNPSCKKEMLKLIRINDKVKVV
jgi:hypothetical protein